MSVVGVDLGTLNTVIAVARNRGVDVVSDGQMFISRARWPSDSSDLPTM